MNVSVILCTYNRAPLLRRVLDELAAQRTPPDLEWEVLVVDNNSNDGTAELAQAFVQKHPGRFRYAHVARQGKAWALNASLEMVDRDVLAFTDDDVAIDRDWLSELTRPFADPTYMNTEKRILPVFNHGQPSWLQGPLLRELRGPLVTFDMGEQPCMLSLAPYGANMAFRREIFQRHPRFRTDLGPRGRNAIKGEDIEFAARIIEAREPLAYVPSALVRHPVEPERLQRRYFWRWWFAHGITTAKTEDLPPGAATFFGVPLYLVWGACRSLVRALLSRDQKQRLSHLFQVAAACGEVVASVGRDRQSRNRQAAAAG